MKTQTILLSLLASVTASGCKAIECGEGTVERDGVCQPPEGMFDPALCGPFTEMQGDRCVPVFPPTECDPDTTAPTVDEATGVTICIGTGGGGCSGPIACPTPSSSSRMTICGQLYDFETNEKFAAPNASGAMCNPAMPAAEGPCALGIQAYNAVEFAEGSTTPLPGTTFTIDDCGRFRVENIDTAAAGPYTGLGIDDLAGLGPDGVTVTAAVATPTKPQTAVRDLEAWIVKPSTVGQWAAGGVSLQTGVYAPIYRKHKLGGGGDSFANQEGVQVAKDGSNAGVADFYFPAAATTRGALDPTANMTGANGTALVTNASLEDGTLAYTGIGGLGPGCVWDGHAGASLPGIVFIQVFRKADRFGETCND